MMKFFLFLTILYFALSHRIVRCHRNREYFYQVETDLDTLGQEPIKIEAQMAIHCSKTLKLKKDDLIYFRVAIKSIIFKQSGGQKPYPRKTDGFTEFAINRKGEIQQYLHLKNEDPIVTSIKKSFISVIETKLRGVSRVETNQVGKIRYTYQHRIDERGRNIVIKTARPKDVLARSDKRLNLKTSRYNFKGVSYFSADGEFMGGETVVSDIIGAQGPQRTRQAAKLNAGAKADSPPAPKKVNDAKGSNSKILITLVEKKKLVSPTTSFTSVLEGNLNVHEDVKVTDMSFAPEAAAAVEILHRNVLSKRVDFPRLLERVRTESRPEVHSEAHTYANVFSSEALKHVEEKFNTLDFSNQEHIEYAGKLQSIMVASQSEHGQTLFVNTLSNPHLVLGGIIRALSVEKPSEHLIDRLHTLSTSKSEDFGSDAHVLEKDMDLVRTSSYMVYAHTASKIHEENKEKAREIVLNISDRMANAQDFVQLNHVVHALGNAGEAVPLSAVQEIINSEDIPLSVKVSAVNGLSKRTSEKTEVETTEYIHTLVNEHPEESVKVAAVFAQLERERENPTGASVEEFQFHLDNPTMTLSVKDAINKYLEEAVVEDESTVLDDKKTQDTKSTWQKIKDKLGLNAAAFDPAQKVCVSPVKGQTADFCSQSAGAGQFLTQMNQKYNFQDYDVLGKAEIEETISGLEFAHRVVSDLAYVAQKTTTAQNGDKTTNFLNIQRKERYASVFNRHINFITFYKIITTTTQFVKGTPAVKATKTTRERPKTEDREVTKTDLVFYLKVRNTVIVPEIDPRKDDDKAQEAFRCLKFKREIKKVEANPIASIGFIVMAGPVPLKFSVGVSAGIAVQGSLLLCWADKIVALGVSVTADFGVFGSASLSILIAEVGLQISVGSAIEVTKTLGFSKFRLCSALRYEIKPIYIKVDAYGSILWFKKSLNLFTWSPVESIVKHRIEGEQKFINMKTKLGTAKKEEYEKAVEEELKERLGKWLDRTVLGVCKDTLTGEVKRLASDDNPFKTTKEPLEIEINFDFKFPSDKESYDDTMKEFSKHQKVL